MERNRIGDYLQQYLSKGTTIEVRAITPNKRKLQAAYVSHDNIGTVLDEIMNLSQAGYNLYTNQVSLPVEQYPPSSFHRRSQYFRTSSTTERFVLPIDIDPIRTNHHGLKQPSTQTQRIHASHTAQKIKEHLAQKYDLQSITANSGNGSYVLSRLQDTPANSQTEEVIKHICRQLKSHFDDDIVSVDLCTTKHSSLFRLFGTRNWTQNIDGSLSSTPSHLIEQTILPIQSLPTVNLAKTSSRRLDSRISQRPETISRNQINDVELLVHQIEERIELSLVYGPYLTGNTTHHGDLYCIDPFHQGSNNMGCVSLGNRHNRGRFYSFATQEPMSLVHFYQTLHNLSYIEACTQLAALSNIQ